MRLGEGEIYPYPIVTAGRIYRHAIPRMSEVREKGDYAHSDLLRKDLEQQGWKVAFGHRDRRPDGIYYDWRGSNYEVEVLREGTHALWRGHLVEGRR